MAVLAAVYFAAAKLGLSFGALKGNVTPVWPPTGIALVALVLVDRRLWPGVFLGALAVNGVGSLPAAVAVGMAVGNTCEAVIGAWLLSRARRFHPAMERVAHVLAFVGLGVIAATLVSASIGVSSLVVGGVVPRAAAWSTWRVWWMGDALGALIIAPLVFAWTGLRSRPRLRPTAYEAAALIAAICAVGTTVFSGHFNRSYPLFPVIIWAALRFRHRGAASATFAIYIAAVASTAAGIGPFAHGTTVENFWDLDMFLAILALTGLILAAVVSERDRASDEIERFNERLQASLDELRAAHEVATQDLRRSEASLVRAQQVGEIGSWEWALDTDVLTWSNEMFRIYAVDRDHFVPGRETYLAMLHPDDRAAVRSVVEAAAGADDSYQMDHRIVRDGSVRFIQARGETVRDTAGCPIALVGTAQDVTAVHEQNAALRDAEERFRLAFDNAPIGKTLVSPDGRYLRVNQALCDIVGYTSDELLHMSFADLSHEDDLEVDRDFVERMLRGDIETYQREKRYIHARGHTVWVQLNVSLVRDEDGAPEYFVSQIQDITGRKATEAELRSSEERFRRLASSAPVGIFQTDAVGRCVYVNPAWISTCGTSAEGVLGASWTSVAHPADRERVIAGWKAATDRQTAFEDRLRVTSDDAAARWIDVRVQPLPREQGRPPSWVGTASDVTPIVEAVDAIADARDEAMRASQLKSQFLANMSHEIRTPMNGVIGIAELLADSPLSGAQREQVAALSAAGRSLLGLLNDILDLAKIEAGKTTLEVTAFDLHALIGDTTELFTAAANAKGLEFRVTVDPDVPRWITSDPTRLRQILSNLLGNAVKFTERGQVALRVGAQTDRLVVGVSDTGIGIADDALAKIMHPFEQADASTTRRFGGSGLGLAICNELATLMDGTLTVTSTKNVGATFTLVIPLVEAAGVVVEAGPPATTVTSNGGRRRVLLAEDNAVNQLVARAMLERQGWSVEVVENGQLAIDACERGDFDLVILDCQMPVLDGFGAAEAIRGMPRPKADVPILAMTATALPEDHQRCLSSGMDAVLVKPVTVASLADALHHLTHRAPI